MHAVMRSNQAVYDSYNADEHVVDKGLSMIRMSNVLPMREVFNCTGEVLVTYAGVR